MSEFDTSSERFRKVAIVSALFGVVGAGLIKLIWGSSFFWATIGWFILITLVVFVILWYSWAHADEGAARDGAGASGTGSAAAGPSGTGSSMEGAAHGAGVAAGAAGAAVAAGAATAARSASDAGQSASSAVGDAASVTAGGVAAAKDAASDAASTASDAASDATQAAGDAAASATDAAGDAVDAAKDMASGAADAAQEAASDTAGAITGDDGEVLTGEEAAMAVAVVRPEALSGARDGKPDDLKQIKGVGPKLEELCHSLGFYHFDQIANWSGSEVAWVDQNLEGFKGRVTRDEWVSQAKILAEGGETEFSKKVDKGGVY